MPTIEISTDASGWPTYKGFDGQMHPMKAYTCVHCGAVFGAIVPVKRPNCGQCDMGAAVAASNRDFVRRIREAYTDAEGNCTCRERGCPECDPE